MLCKQHWISNKLELICVKLSSACVSYWLTSGQLGHAAAAYNNPLFLDAIASLEIPYIQVTYLPTHLLTYSQSWNHLLGHDSRPFRQVQVIKKAIIAITAIMAITAITAIMAIRAMTAILAIIAFS